MITIDPKAIGWGAIIVAIVSLIGLWIRRRTILDSQNIDDMGQFRKELMAQAATHAAARDVRLGLLERAVNHLQDRDAVFMRMFAMMGAEVRLLNGHMQLHKMQLMSEVLDPKELRKQADMIAETVTRIEDLLERERINLEHAEHIEQDNIRISSVEQKSTAVESHAVKKTEWDSLGKDGG